MNIGTIADAAAIGDPDRVALIIDRDTIGYGQLAATVERWLRVWQPTVWRPEAASPSSTAAACFPSHRCSRQRASVQRQR
jgi:hypothetical protein